MTMRVGILTLHLHVNYGGIVQAAALYRFLADNGYDPILLRKEPARPWYGRLARRLLRRLPGHDIGRIRSNERSRATHYAFIDAFLPKRTGTAADSRGLARLVRRHALDAVVVGSDQVWRPSYHQDGNTAAWFLDFVPDATVRKVSYAASFGTSEWTHSDRTAEVTRALARFDAVSVREVSGLDICNAAFGRTDARLVLDPTLLVDPGLYAEAAGLASGNSGPTVLSYILDQSDARRALCASARAALGTSHRLRSLSPYGDAEKVTIPEWLRAFRNADFVITDSYHGTIFAIIFRRNFIAIGNRRRGLDRFTTLLDNLGLANRLVVDDEPVDVEDLVATPIDYTAVAERLEPLRAQSRDFLLAALGLPDGTRGKPRPVKDIAA